MIKRWSHKVDWRESDIGSIFTSVEADEDPKGQYVLYKDHLEALEEAVAEERASVMAYVLDMCDQLIEDREFNPEAIHELRDLLKDVYK